MNFDAIRYFATAYEQGSIHKAAESLYISPQGLSQSIKQLEESFSEALFIRTNRGLVPTSFGKQVYDYARRIVADLDDLEGFLVQHKSGVSSELSLVVCGGFNRNTYTVPSIISKFEQENPSVICTTSYVEVADDVYDQLYTEKVDIGIICYSCEREGFSYLPIKKLKVNCVLSKDNPLARKSSLTWSQVADIPLFSAHRSDPFSAEVRDNFKRYGIEPPAAIYSTDIGVLAHAIEGDHAMGMLSKTYSLAVQKLSDNIAVLPVEPPLFINVGFVLKDRQTKDSLAYEFLEFISETLISQEEMS
ncbi:MAG: LysR family transcriptional regulator [Coriobacteriales bacterium]|nr:LysR family transcriptional regulator [Coriobacteriales bacterium]